MKLVLLWLQTSDLENLIITFTTVWKVVSAWGFHQKTFYDILLVLNENGVNLTSNMTMLVTILIIISLLLLDRGHINMGFLPEDFLWSLVDSIWSSNMALTAVILKILFSRLLMNGWSYWHGVFTKRPLLMSNWFSGATVTWLVVCQTNNPHVKGLIPVQAGASVFGKST